MWRIFISILILVPSLAWAYSRGNYVGGKIKYTEDLGSDDVYTAEFSMREDINEDQWELLEILHMNMRCGEKFYLKQLSYPRRDPDRPGLIDSAQLKFSCHDRPIVSGETKERILERIKRLCRRGDAAPFRSHCEKLVKLD